MTVQPPTRRSFDRASGVLDYWLAHAEGFRVDAPGLRRARVEQVLLGADGVHAHALVVSHGPLARVTVVPASAVASVDPFAGRLVAERTKRRRVRSPRVRPRLATAARRAAPRVAAFFSAVGDGAALVAAGTVRLLSAGGRSVAAGSRRAARWTAPRIVAAARFTAAAVAAGAGRLQKTLPPAR